LPAGSAPITQIESRQKTVTCSTISSSNKQQQQQQRQQQQHSGATTSSKETSKPEIQPRLGPLPKYLQVEKESTTTKHLITVKNTFLTQINLVVCSRQICGSGPSKKSAV
jgi:hypothetical protein